MADQLARGVFQQYSDEAVRLRLFNPYPLPVRWQPIDHDLAFPWEAITQLALSPEWPRVSRAKWAGSDEALYGSSNDDIDVLERIPTGRLVVTGDWGSGKSILLVRMAISSLRKRKPGDPVPIVFSLSSWNPVDQGYYEWLESRLIADHNALAERRERRSRASELLKERLVLPVLDGLDELPPTARALAVAQISNEVRPGHGFILSIRTSDYRSIKHPVGGSGVHLTGAAGIRLVPLEMGVIVSYLRASAGSQQSADRWEPVFNSLICDQSSTIASTLSNPLMTSLARDIYNPAGDESTDAVRNPAEMLDQQTFTSSELVQQHLLGQLIAAAYRRAPGSPANTEHKRQRARERHAKWLMFLAHDLDATRQRATDIAFWQLTRAVNPALTPIAVGVFAGSLATVSMAALIRYPEGFGVDLGVGLLVAQIYAFTVRAALRKQTQVLVRGLVGGLLGGLAAAVLAVTAFGYGRSNQYVGAFVVGGLFYGIVMIPHGSIRISFIGAFAGELSAATILHKTLSGDGLPVSEIVTLIVNGVGIGLAAAAPVILTRRTEPAPRVAWSYRGLLFGLVIGPGLGLATWSQLGLREGLITGFVGLVAGAYAGGFAFPRSSQPLEMAANPRRALKGDRSTFLLSGASTGLAVGLGAGVTGALSPGRFSPAPNGVAFGIGIGLANLVVVLVSVGFMRASWGGWFVARIWLAIRGRLPWRILAFLEDAHRRGVLRQNGVVYQFRHIELQHELASAYKERSGQRIR